MPRVCTICTHPEREAIDRALVEQGAYRNIAGRFGLAKSALYRHRCEHLPASLAKAKEAEQIVQANDLLTQLQALRNKALSLLVKAEKAGDLKTALLGVREARACIELLAEMEQQIDRRPQVNVLVASPEWLNMRGAIVRALESFPEAKRAVVEVLSAGG